MQELIQLSRDLANLQTTVSASYHVVDSFHKLILDELPYGQIDDKNLVQGQIELDGPAQLTENPNSKKPLQWHFGGIPYEVCKAARIQYSYAKYIDGVQVNAAGSLFFGYVVDKPSLGELARRALAAALELASAEEVAEVARAKARTDIGHLDRALMARGAPAVDADHNGTHSDIARFRAELARWPTRVTPVALSITAGNFDEFVAEQFPFATSKSLHDLINKKADGGLPGVRIEYDGPATDYNSHKPFPYTTDSLFNDPSGIYNKVLWWYFGGKAFRITKAMRIEYDDRAGNQGSLLIGYQGPGPS